METAVKRLYEGLFLVDSALAASQWNELMGAIRKILDRADADVVSLKKWDDRKLAYEIRGISRGTYILVYFHCDPLRIGAIERDVTLSEQILRVLILRTDRMSQDDINRPTPAEAHPEIAAAESDEAVEEEPAVEAVEAVEEPSDESSDEFSEEEPS